MKLVNESLESVLKAKSPEEVREVKIKQLKEIIRQYKSFKAFALKSFYDPIDFPEDVKFKLRSLSKQKKDLEWELYPEKEKAKQKKADVRHSKKIKINSAKIKEIKKYILNKFPDVKIAERIYDLWSYSAPSYMRLEDKSHYRKLKKLEQLKAQKILDDSIFDNISRVKEYIIDVRKEINLLKKKNGAIGRII